MASTIRQVPFLCKTCSNQIGLLVSVDKQTFLFAGRWIIEHGFTHCALCGQVSHFRKTSKDLPELQRIYVEQFSNSFEPLITRKKTPNFVTFGKMVTVPMACTVCASPLGRMVEDAEGRIWLDTGEWGVSLGFNYCHLCGNLFAFKRPKTSIIAFAAIAKAQTVQPTIYDLFNRKNP